MTSEEWQRIRELFEQAVGLDAGERTAFLDQACAGNLRLRNEVHSLLEAHDRSPDFFEAPAYEVAAELLVDPPDSLAGRTLGPYLIRHEIGRGGMGIVYLAEDMRLSRRVALKAIASCGTSDPERRERLRREARAAAALSHPGIATVYALEEIDQELYLACEYVPGSTLRTLIDQGPLPLPQVVEIATELAQALAAAHAQGIVHRDLKPENIIKSPAGIVKILDFGVARLENIAGPRVTRNGATIGTPGYMAPEQIRHEDADFRTDLFALGVLVYEMASGANPFEAQSTTATIARILETDPAPLSAVCPTGSSALDVVVTTCLQKDPRQRYSSTQALLRDLQRVQDQSTPNDHTTGVVGPSIPGLTSDQHPGRFTPRWWWEVHQLITSVVYVLMLYPAWRARVWLPKPFDLWFFFVVVASAAVAVTIRLHLVFTARFYPSELHTPRVRALPWIRCSDLTFSAALVLAAFAGGGGHPEVATLLVAVAIATVLATFIIEPTTTRAAFGERR